MEQEAVETAQQLQTALNDLSAKKPELYRQQAGAFERAWQELGLELVGAEPQARVQEAPKAQEAAKVDFSTVDSRAFMRHMARAAKNNGPEWKHLDELTRRIESSKAKEKLEVPLYYVNRMKEDSMRTIRTVDTPEESAGDYSIGGIGLQKLRKHMKQLHNSDPKLYGEVFGPFVQAMGKIDFTQEQASYSELVQKQKAEQAEEKDQERQAQEEAMRRKVTLYGNVEVTDNTGIYHFDRIRNDIVNDPGFREDPPSIDPQQMARLIFVTANATDFGVDQPLSPDFKDAIESESKRMLKGAPTYYERLAKEPEVARLLSQREEGQTWYATSQRKLAGYMLDVFDKRHEPNRASEEARKAASAALTEAYDTMREYGSTLQDAGNEEIGVFYKCLREAQRKQGNSRAADNLDLAASGRAFLDSITAPGTEQTTETRECFKATLTAMRALSPADEFAQVCRDMNERRGIADNPADLDYVTPEMFDAKDLKSGLKLIDDLKKNLKTDESARDAAAKIMAARILTNTKGGKASYLDMPISQTRVDQVAAALKGSESFSRWLGGLDKNKAARLLSGHGGDLEKSFKDHLKKLPAGELKNDPALRRYMPTAKERIEELQKQAEAAGKERKELRKRYAGMYKEYKVKQAGMQQVQAAARGFTGGYLRAALAGAGKLAEDKEKKFKIDDLTTGLRGSSPEFDKMAAAAKKAAEMERELRATPIAPTTYNQRRREIDEAVEELGRTSDAYLEKKMRERKAKSLEELRGKNDYEQARIDHAKRIREFALAYEKPVPLRGEDVTAMTKQDLEEGRIASELGEMQDKQQAMKLVAELYAKQQKPGTPDLETLLQQQKEDREKQSVEVQSKVDPKLIFKPIKQPEPGGPEVGA